MKINKKYMAQGYGSKRASTKWIVIHYTGNSKDTAKANALYFHNSHVSAGAHYFVDSTGVYASTPEANKSWSVGRLYNIVYAKYWGSCTNANSLNIEIADDAGNYKAKQAGIDNAIDLTKDLMKKYGIDSAHVIRHKDCCGKDCPDFFWNDQKWKTGFKNKLNTTTKKKVNKSTAYYDSTGLYKVLTADRLIRADAKLKAKVVGHITDRGTYTITQTKKDGSIVYGKLASGAGWISLKRTYVKKIK